MTSNITHDKYLEEMREFISLADSNYLTLLENTCFLAFIERCNITFTRGGINRNMKSIIPLVQQNIAVYDIQPRKAGENQSAPVTIVCSQLHSSKGLLGTFTRKIQQGSNPCKECETLKGKWERKAEYALELFTSYGHLVTEFCPGNEVTYICGKCKKIHTSSQLNKIDCKQYNTGEIRGINIPDITNKDSRQSQQQQLAYLTFVKEWFSRFGTEPKEWKYPQVFYTFMYAGNNQVFARNSQGVIDLVYRLSEGGCTLYDFDITDPVIPTVVVICPQLHCYKSTRANLVLRMKKEQSACGICHKEENITETDEEYKQRVQDTYGHLVIGFPNRLEVEYICGNCNAKSTINRSMMWKKTQGDCSKCSSIKRRTPEDEVREEVKGYGVELISYNGNKALVVRCKCGDIWTASKHDIKRGRNCIICKKNKRYETNLEKYGVVNPFSNPEIIKKIQQTNLERYGYIYAHMNPQFIAALYADKKFQCKECKYRSDDEDKFKEHVYLAHTKEGNSKLAKKERVILDLLDREKILYKPQHCIDFTCIGKDREGSRCYIDMVIEAQGGIIFFEVDETQHKHYNVSCELRRMTDVHRSLLMEGNTLPILFLRYNPDVFKIDNVEHTLDYRKRQKLLIKAIREVKFTQPFGVQYMFYDSIDGAPAFILDEEFDDLFLPVILGNTLN